METHLPDGSGVIDSFRGQFRNLCEDGNETATFLVSRARDVTDHKGYLVPIPAGSFTIGTPDGEGSDMHLHEATLSRFWLARFPVTNAEYELFDPSHMQRRWIDEAKGYEYTTTEEDTDEHPAVNVSWHDAWVYCRWLGQGFRLPTEAQWEYACRAGELGPSRWCFGDDESKLGEFAWYSQNAGGHTHPVGRRKANPWGLYDMHGNVWEWCESWHRSDDYRQGDPEAPRVLGFRSFRVHRGGSWGDEDGDCRSANRGGGDPASVLHDLGFRVCLLD